MNSLKNLIVGTTPDCQAKESPQTNQKLIYKGTYFLLRCADPFVCLVPTLALSRMESGIVKNRDEGVLRVKQ